MSVKTLFWEDNFSFVITNNKVFLFRVQEIVYQSVEKTTAKDHVSGCQYQLSVMSVNNIRPTYRHQ